MRTYSFTRGEGESAKAVTYTEEQVKAAEIIIPVGDGQAFYRVASIGRGNNPVCSLQPVDKGTTKYGDVEVSNNEYAHGEKLLWLTEVIQNIEWYRILDEQFARNKAKNIGKEKVGNEKSSG